MNPARYRKVSQQRIVYMASRAAVDFERNLYTPSVTHALQYARQRGKHHDIFSSHFVCDLHQRITGHNLPGSCYRASEVMFGQFGTRQIPHPTAIPAMMLALAQDTNWLLNSNTDTMTVVARVVSRLVAMQPFQDGNKRTAFAVSAYLFAYRGENCVLLPRMQDARTFADAIYNGDETQIINLLKNWYRRLPDA